LQPLRFHPTYFTKPSLLKKVVDLAPITLKAQQIAENHMRQPQSLSRNGIIW